VLSELFCGYDVQGSCWVSADSYLCLHQDAWLQFHSCFEFVKCLSNGPYKKDSATWQGMQKGANFCATLLLLYHTSGWLSQQTLPKLQVAVYTFIHNWSTIFLSAKSLLSLNTTVILHVCGEHWKIGSFYCLCLQLLWLVECFNTRKLPFKIEFKYILFHKPAFHWVIRSPYENTTVSMWGKRIAAEQ